MSVSALRGGRAIARRPARPPAASRRLAWISVILGLMSIDLEALALLSRVIPTPFAWYANLLLLYGPTAVVTVAMLALGAPLALAGLGCAAATVRRGRVPFTMPLGVALCSMSLAVPLCYAIFVVMYLRGLV
ncbi:MAG TPA: hypothetical protein VE338_13190 [Ktedonobacterales bacterium]|jgi:hypothetical protein|nr:hypothetical protein [Ktedonobacterales bacterium]